LELRFETNVPDPDAGKVVDGLSRTVAVSRKGVSFFTGVIGKSERHAGSLNSFGGKCFHRVEFADDFQSVQAENAIAAENAIQDAGIAMHTVGLRNDGRYAREPERQVRRRQG